MPGILNRFLPSNFGAQRCPDCDESLKAVDINIQEGVALCPACGKLSRLSSLNTSSRSIAEILDKPPSGCSLASYGHGAVASVSLRSFAGFLFPAGFALFWNGITSVFVLIAIAGLYTNLIGPLPNWFPAPGMQNGKPVMNDAPMDLGMSLFLCIFLIPFVTVGVVITAVSLMNLMGKVEVVIDEMDSYATTGLGFLKWKKRFDPRDVRAIEFGSRWQSESSNNQVLEIQATRTVKFGSMLNDEQMQWLRAVLREILLQQTINSKQKSSLPVLPWLSRAQEHRNPTR